MSVFIRCKKCDKTMIPRTEFPSDWCRPCATKEDSVKLLVNSIFPANTSTVTTDSTNSRQTIISGSGFESDIVYNVSDPAIYKYGVTDDTGQFLRDDSPDWGEIEIDTQALIDAYNGLFALVTELDINLSRALHLHLNQTTRIRSEYRERINAHHADFMAKLKPLLP